MMMKMAKDNNSCKSTIKSGSLINDGSLDLVSNLPDNVKSLILGFLPMKDAMRTGTLSSKWRHMWTSIPDLDFKVDKDCWKHELTKEENLVLCGIVDRVLKIHNGPIHVFRLSLRLESRWGLPKRKNVHWCENQFFSGKAIHDRWIPFLVKSGIVELDLDISSEQYVYELPSCFFECETVRVVKLKMCFFRPPPPRFIGLKCLESLSLSEVYLTNEGIKSILHECKLLRTLKLERCSGFTGYNNCDQSIHLENLELELCDDVHVNDPNLRFIRYSGLLPLIFLENTSGLVNAIISTEYIYASPPQDDVKKFIKNLSNLVSVESLSLTGQIVKFLAECKLPKQMPSPFFILKRLELELTLSNLLEVRIFSCLLRSSPSLEQIIVHIYRDGEGFYPDQLYSKPEYLPLGDYWEKGESYGCLIHHVQRIEIKQFRGVDDEMDFLKFMLSNALVLKEMVINGNKEMGLERRLDLAEELLKLPRASQAKVVFTRNVNLH